MSFDVEKGFISKLLQTKDILTIKDSQIKPSFFTGVNKSAFQFILDKVSSTGEVPTVRAFKRKFPSYSLETVNIIDENGGSTEEVGTEENLKFWCEELRVKVKHNSLAGAVDKVAEKLQDFKTDEAYTLLKKEIAFIETDVSETQDVDLTQNTEERKKAYLDKKHNKGMRGLSTGFPHLDYVLKGLEKETLTTLIALTGTGKALTLDTPVLTPEGFVPMKDIKVGSSVCAKDGKFYNVSAVYPYSNRQVYRVSFEDDTYVDCCKDHLWIFKTLDDVHRKNDWRVKTTEELMTEFPVKRGKSFNLCVPVNEEVHFEKKDLPLDPYVLGVLLGDGGFTTDRISFTGVDDSILSELNNLLSDWGQFTSTTDNNYQYNFRSHDFRTNKLYRAVKDLGLIGLKSDKKFIPEEYLHSSVEDRIRLLQGLIDTDGSVSIKGGISYFTCSEKLKDGFMFLVRSVGYRCTSSTYKREGRAVEYVVRISARTNRLIHSDSRLSRWNKRRIPKRVNYYDYLKIVDIEARNEFTDMQCITVDSPDHSFICGDFIVTHNTWFEIRLGAYCMLQNCRVLQFVTEMSDETMRDRYEAMLFSMCYGELNYNSFKSGTLSPEVEKKYFTFLEEDLPNFEPLIISTATGVMGVSASIDKYKPDIVLIDGVYLMEDDQNSDSDWLRVAHITRDLKKLAKREKIPILINTQADKNTSKKTGPELGSISYSQACGQDSDVVLALYRDEIMINDKEMGLKILKQREGTLGKVILNWNFDTMDFSEIYMEQSGDAEKDELTESKSVEAKGVIGIDNVTS